MAVPPGFARDVKLRGKEEIRFAPGMFDHTKPDYFTCIIAITLDDERELAAADLQDFLEKYYGGLSLADQAERFTAEIGFFDPFTDGRHITLHVEASQHRVPATKANGVILLVSPSAKDSEIWTNLRQIGRSAEANLALPK